MCSTTSGTEKEPELAGIAGAQERIPGRRCFGGHSAFSGTLPTLHQHPSEANRRSLQQNEECPHVRRLDTIEEKLAHLEQAVSQLSDVVARQQKDLDRALERNQRLLEKLAALESDAGPSATAHEKPPHY